MVAKQASILPKRPKDKKPPESSDGLNSVFSSNPKPQTFLWMPPQNDQSQSQTTADLHKEKQRFIRANHHRKRKEQKAQALKDSIQLASPAHSNSHSQSSPSSASIALSTRSSDSQSPATIQNTSSPNEPIIYQWIEPQILDIFPSPKKSTKQDWNIYFNHFRLYTSAFIFPFSGPDRSIWYYNKAQDHPILIEVLTASGAFTRAAGLMIKGISPQAARKCTQDALQLQSQAVASLQRVLNHPTKASLEVAISVVATLMYLGGFEANSATLDMHMNGLKIIINLLGGLDNLDSETQASLYSADCTRAFANNLNLFFDISWAWEAKVHGEIAQITTTTKTTHPSESRLASSFTNTIWFDSINPRLKVLIDSLKWIILNFEGIIHVDNQFSETKNDYLVLTTYRLISLHKDTDITSFEDTIRLTMLLYTVTRLWTIPPQQCEGFIEVNLMPSLRDSYEEMRDLAPDLLFWVLFVGGYASRGLECHRWFLEGLVECAVSRGISSWDKACGVLERFFFVQRGTEEPWRGFWDDVMKDDVFL